MTEISVLSGFVICRIYSDTGLIEQAIEGSLVRKHPTGR